jgi:hypothetical protein
MSLQGKAAAEAARRDKKGQKVYAVRQVHNEEELRADPFSACLSSRDGMEFNVGVVVDVDKAGTKFWDDGKHVTEP